MCSVNNDNFKPYFPNLMPLIISWITVQARISNIRLTRVVTGKNFVYYLTLKKMVPFQLFFNKYFESIALKR
jgi:hypothetical protein